MELKLKNSIHHASQCWFSLSHNLALVQPLEQLVDARKGQVEQFQIMSDTLKLGLYQRLRWYLEVLRRIPAQDDQINQPQILSFDTDTHVDVAWERVSERAKLTK